MFDLLDHNWKVDHKVNQQVIEYPWFGNWVFPGLGMCHIGLCKSCPFIKENGIEFPDVNYLKSLSNTFVWTWAHLTYRHGLHWRPNTNNNIERSQFSNICKAKQSNVKKQFKRKGRKYILYMRTYKIYHSNTYWLMISFLWSGYHSQIPNILSALDFFNAWQKFNLDYFHAKKIKH